MSSPRSTIITFAAFALATLLSQPATAVRSAGYSVEVLIHGQPVRELHARNTTYVEAINGCEYSVRLTNHTGRRVAIALAVDGLNSIDARSTTAREAAKWVLGPYETVTVDGWQTGIDTARKFFFTSESASYGAWLGKTDNLGVIEAVVFRERRTWPKLYKERGEVRGRDSGRTSSAAPRAQSDAEAKSRSAQQKPSEEGLSDELAATGIGRQVDNPVRRVEFVAERNPASTLRIRYEYRDQLVSLGVIPRPQPTALERRELARGFREMEFAPDPYCVRR